MKRFLLVPIVVVSLSLSGCASLGEKFLNLPTGILTASVQNPIGLNESYEIEAAYATALTGARAYFRLRQCRASEAATISNPCARRSVKLKIQQSDRAIRAILVPFRQFVRENDMVSAGSLVGPLRAAITNIRNAVSGATP